MPNPGKMTRPGGRPKTYDSSVNVRVHRKTDATLRAIATFENLELADLVRMWFTEKKDKYWRNRYFLEWLERKKEDLKQKLIDVDLILE